MKLSKKEFIEELLAESKGKISAESAEAYYNIKRTFEGFDDASSKISEIRRIPKERISDALIRKRNAAEMRVLTCSGITPKDAKDIMVEKKKKEMSDACPAAIFDPELRKEAEMKKKLAVLKVKGRGNMR